MDRHAFLIIAHRVDSTLITLLQLLDDPENDIFIHMDKKNRTYREEEVLSVCKKSRVYHSRRTNVMWGGYSQINSEIILLKKATSTGNYRYYHLISGQDMPIKDMETIHRFYQEHQGTEFIGFARTQDGIESRIDRYWLQNLVGRNLQGYHSGRRKFCYALNNILLKLQDRLHLKRKIGFPLYKGMNWFSITDSLARYVVSKERWIRHYFRFSTCADELFLQTLVMNSPFADKVRGGDELAATMRLIDWDRGCPYVFRSSDFEELKNSDKLFARKFDAATDDGILAMLKEMIRPAS